MSDADKKPQARGGDMDAPERISVEFNEAGFPVGTWVGGFGQDSTTYIRADLMAELVEATYYIDCEFDGHNGPLLSIAMVRGDGYSLHVAVRDIAISDPWVAENVLPIIDSHNADIGCRVRINEVGRVLRSFIGNCPNPTIIADSPVDIGRFCRTISTGSDGGWASADYPGMTFIVRNVDCYPTTLQGAVQHNAWWDAMALRAALAKIKEQPK